MSEELVNCSAHVLQLMMYIGPKRPAPGPASGQLLVSPSGTRPVLCVNHLWHPAALTHRSVFSLVRKEAAQAAKSSSLMHPKAAFFKDKHNQTLVDHCKCSFLIDLTNIVEVTITLLKTPMVFKKPLPTITLRSSTLYHPLPIPRIHALRDVTAPAPKARNISHLPHSPQTSLTPGKTTRRREIGRCDVSHSA